jgi:MULE transposase domain
VIKNCIASLMESEQECEEAAQGIHDLETDRAVDFASSSTTHQLGCLVWALKGSRTVVIKYGGDFATSDSTHHVTRYDFKLWSLKLLDTDRWSRVVFMALIVDETKSTLRKLLCDYMRALDSRLPRTMLTDNDAAFSAAISGLDDPPIRKLCRWHLYDMNIHSPEICSCACWRPWCVAPISH